MDAEQLDLLHVLEAADDWWKDCATRALEQLAATGARFDAHDLTELGVPDPDHPARWGALFQAAVRRGLIVPVGYRPARRPSRHGGVVRVWRGARHDDEREAA